MKTTEEEEGGEEKERKVKEAYKNADEPRMFSCNVCENKIPATRKAFCSTTLDTKTWCGRCKKSLMAKGFACPCGAPWYKCVIHGEVNKRIDMGKTSVGSTQKQGEKDLTRKGKSKVRKAYEGYDLEGINTEKRSRKASLCEPVFRSSMLSAGLKRKFAHLCQEDTDA